MSRSSLRGNDRAGGWPLLMDRAGRESGFSCVFSLVAAVCMR